MKALSIKAGYAMQIARRRKLIEYRSWGTDYRGPLLIHASSKKDRCGVIYDGEPIKIIPGHIIAMTALDRVEWSEGDRCYHWILVGTQLIRPIPQKGRLHLWEYDGAIQLITTPEEQEKYFDKLLV